ncbi:MAG: MFS transporter, partial [Oscillospiraceae bacterium]|nr:MFS transporter [Oscillospiraceae bacterium]
MKFTHRHTIYACFLGYIVQAVINNFAPLLFLTFQTQYKISLSQITTLIGFNFVVQLCVDFASAGFAERLGYRRTMLLAHSFCIAGFVALGTLPELLPDSYFGLLIAVFMYAIGGGLLEVLVSPIVEACPTENKEKTMSLLHSFYCWGVVAVIVLSTTFFVVFGIEHWRVLAFIWTVLPIFDGILFILVPIEKPVAEGKGMRLSELLKNKSFFVFFAMMLCAGATEMAVSQWASTLCENALGVTKTLGDLCGMAGFAVFMGLSRALFGKFGECISLGKAMTVSSLLCVFSYLLIAIVPSVAAGLIGCALCGFGVGILWPGTFSKSSAALPSGGTMMFALLALAGDI